MGLNFDDLHHFLFNEDYYIIGYYQAEQFIKENDLNTFDLISYCQEQEKEHFGEIHSTCVVRTCETTTPIESFLRKRRESNRISKKEEPILLWRDPTRQTNIT